MTLATVFLGPVLSGDGAEWTLIGQRLTSESIDARPGFPTDVQSVTVEFEATPEMQARAADGTFVVSAFQVGFFSDRSSLVRALQVPRDRARVNGTRIAVDVPLFPQSRGVPSELAIRVRPLSSSALGPWSDAASGKVRLLAPAPDSRAGAMAPQRRPLSIADVERLPALMSSITSQLGARMPVEVAVTRYANISDLALAVALGAEKHVSLVELTEAMRDSTSLVKAIGKVAPKLDIRRAVNDVRPAARALTLSPR